MAIALASRIPSQLAFDPEGIVGALSTPWGDGRWGSLPAEPGLLWADFASRTHILQVRGCTVRSHRCADNETLTVTSSMADVKESLLSRLVLAPAASGAALACTDPAGAAAPSQGRCARSVRLGPWTWLSRRGSPHRSAQTEQQAAVLAVGGGATAGGGGGAACVAPDALDDPTARPSSGGGSASGGSASGGGASGGGEACALADWQCAAESPPKTAGASTFNVLALRGSGRDGRRRGLALVQMGDEALVLPCSALVGGGAAGRAALRVGAGEQCTSIQLASSMAARVEAAEEDDEGEDEEDI